MKLCVFEAGLTPDQFVDRFGYYPEMVKDWLQPELPEAQFAYVSVVRSEAMPNIDDFDGFIITGSKHGVYEDLPWMKDLRSFLLRAKMAEKPVFGICFGHQIMAAAYGAKVEKSDKGWGIGAQSYEYVDGHELAAGASLLFHQDQVETVPDDARVIGGNDFCPIGALSYDFPALSVQYHPEFSKEYLAALTELYGGGRIPQTIADQALESLKEVTVDNQNVARQAAKFFREFAQ